MTKTGAEFPARNISDLAIHYVTSVMDLQLAIANTVEETQHGTQKTTVYAKTAGSVKNVQHIPAPAMYVVMAVLVSLHLIAPNVDRIHIVTRILMNVSVTHTTQDPTAHNTLESVTPCAIRTWDVPDHITAIVMLVMITQKK